MIYQVFAYPSDRFKKVKKGYDSNNLNVPGPNAVNFDYYTVPYDEEKGPYGFVQENSPILSMSGDSAIEESVKNGEWEENKEAHWAKKNSILSPFKEPSISRKKLNSSFTKIVPIAFELASLSLFSEHKRQRVWQRIFKSAMYRKYSDGIKPAFTKNEPYDFKQIFPEDQEGLLSTIATPTIDVYKERLNLNEVKLIASEEVKSFTIFTNVLQQSGGETVKIPGENVTLVAHIIDTDFAPGIPKLELSDEAYKSYTLSCQDFYGSLVIKNQSGTEQRLVADGFCYKLDNSGAEGRYGVSVDQDLRTAPSEKVLKELLPNLEFSLVTAEAVVSDYNADPDLPAQQLIKQYLKWLGTIIPKNTSNLELLELKVRALDLAHVVENPSKGIFVPLLPYKDYQEEVEKVLEFVDNINKNIRDNQQQIERRKQEELIIDVSKTINQNIIQTGEVLTGIVDTNISQQKQLGDYYDTIIAQKQQDINKQKAKVADLQKLVNEQQGQVSSAVQTYKEAVAQWQTLKTIELGLDVVTKLFNIAAVVQIPSTAIKELQELGRAAQVIKKTLKIAKSTSDLYTSAKASATQIKNAQDSLSNSDELGFKQASTLEWDEMNLKFASILGQGPNISAKNALKEAFSILVLRGKALLNAKVNVQKLARDIYLNNKKKSINEDQAERLEKLKGALNPKNIEDLKKSEIDLIGLTGNLVFLQKQMLSILAKAFAMQDRALQYQYLQSPTPISSFSLLDFRSALVKQTENTTKAKEKLAQFQPSTTTPVVYEIEDVMARQLVKGNVHKFTIHLDAKEFWEYVDVRIVGVVAKIEGITSTKSNQYLVNLAYQGQLFHDRNPDRQLLTFSTPRRERTYEYEVGTNKPLFTDEGKSWSKQVSPITPFSTWEISLPETEINEEIQFDEDSVNIELSFILEARIHDKAAVSFQNTATSLQLLAAQSATKQDLLNDMYSQGSALNGWDVVFNMSLDDINRSLKESIW